MATIRTLLQEGNKALQGRPQARLDVQVLAGHVLDVERAALHAYPERAVTEQQERQFRALIARRVQGEPVAYLVGHRAFYDLDMLVDKRVLIPRPETELLVEAALRLVQQRLDGGQRPVVADIGTGSGAIPIVLAVHEQRLPYLYAVDISADALTVARQNCLRYHVEERVQLLQGDLLGPLPERVDVLTANLPYIGTDELEELPTDVRDYEPHLALFSGSDGLDLLRRLFLEMPAKLNQGAVVLLEIGYRQREALTGLLNELAPHADVRIMQDYGGWDRLVQVQW